MSPLLFSLFCHSNAYGSSFRTAKMIATFSRRYIERFEIVYVHRSLARYVVVFGVLISAQSAYTRSYVRGAVFIGHVIHSRTGREARTNGTIIFRFHLPYGFARFRVRSHGSVTAAILVRRMGAPWRLHGLGNGTDSCGFRYELSANAIWAVYATRLLLPLLLLSLLNDY